MSSLENENKSTSNKDNLIKLILIGDSKVGKSSLISRYIEGAYYHNPSVTIGFDYKIKTLIHEDQEYKLHIWDTAGQEKFRSLTLNFYKGVNGIILVFDLTDEESFNNIPHWIRQLKIYASENISMVLLGNKCDLLERKVNSERITELCEDYKLKYFETSAKLNFNVDDAFLHIAKNVRERKKIERNEKNQDESDQKKKGKGVKLKNIKDESISDVSSCNC